MPEVGETVAHLQVPRILTGPVPEILSAWNPFRPHCQLFALSDSLQRVGPEHSFDHSQKIPRTWIPNCHKD